MIIILYLACGLLVGLATYTIARTKETNVSLTLYVLSAIGAAFGAGTLITTSSTGGAISLRSIIVALVGSISGIIIVTSIKKTKKV